MSSYIDKIIKLTNTEIETKHIILCGDKNYIKYCGITMTSVLHSNSAEKFTFELFCDDISDADLEKLKKTQRKYNTNINIYIINKDKINSLIDSVNKETHISVAGFFRILAFESLDSNVRNVLYLDSDILVKGDITEFWDYQFKNDEIAIVIEDSDGKIYGERLEINKYFNSGVMFIDVDKWKKNNCTNRCIKDILTSNYIMVDQDALNVLLNGKLHFFQNEYNFLYNMNDRNNMNRYKISINVYNKMKVIHFIGKIKPWHDLARYFSIAKYYLSEKDNSAWNDIEIINIHILIGFFEKYAYAKSMMRASIHNGQYFNYLKYLYFFCFYKLSISINKIFQ